MNIRTDEDRSPKHFNCYPSTTYARASNHEGPQNELGLIGFRCEIWFDAWLRVALYTRWATHTQTRAFQSRARGEPPACVCVSAGSEPVTVTVCERGRENLLSLKTGALPPWMKERVGDWEWGSAKLGRRRNGQLTRSFRALFYKWQLQRPQPTEKFKTRRWNLISFSLRSFCDSSPRRFFSYCVSVSPARLYYNFFFPLCVCVCVTENTKWDVGKRM